MMSLLQRPKREEGHQTHGSADVPSTTNSEIVGHQPGTSKTPRRRSSALKFFASSTTSKPETGSPHKAWEADYLRDLRANRPTRPGGSRPQPGRATTSKLEPYIRATSALSFRPSCSTRQVDPSVYLNERPASALSHRRAQSDILTINANSLQPNAGVASRDFSPATPTTKAPSVIPSGAYRESGMRWMEKQEARSIRQALEDMDLQNEKKLRAAAQDEASELVWKHRNQGVPYKNPDRPYNYKQHLEKGAHTRSQSHGCYTGYSAALVDHNSGQVSASDRSDSSKEDGDPLRNARNIRITFAEPSKASEDVQSNNGQDHTFRDSPQNLVYLNLKTSARRRSSGARVSTIFRTSFPPFDTFVGCKKYLEGTLLPKFFMIQVLSHKRYAYPET